MWIRGLFLGALAGAVLGVFDFVWALVMGARFTLLLLGMSLALGLCAGALLGCVLATVLHLCFKAAHFFDRGRGRSRAWLMGMAGFLGFPLGLLGTLAGTSGRWAAKLPGRYGLVLLGALIGTGLALMGLWGILGLRKRFAEGTAQRWVWVLLLHGAVAALLLLLDRTLFVRRYQVFHAGLEALAFGVLMHGLWFPNRGRQRQRVFPQRVAIAVAMISSAVFAVESSRQSQPRSLVYQHGMVGAQVLDFALLIGARGQRLFQEDSLGRVRPAERKSFSNELLHGRDVVLITIDALRADRMGHQGYQRPTSPQLDKLAAQGTVFDRAYAPVPATFFSVASLMTGRYAYDLARVGKLQNLPTVAEAFKKQGYKTLALYPPAVFYEGDDQLQSYEARRYGFERTHQEYFDETCDAVLRTDEAIRMLDEEWRSPVFLWVHYFGPHEPYVAPPEWGEPWGHRPSDRYDGEIRQVDREIGRLLAYLDHMRPEAMVAVTADHGEEFGEHRGAYHGTSLYDEQLRVPLVIRVPGLAPQRVSDAVSTVDLPVTLLSLAGVRPLAPVEGTDLSPWIHHGKAAGELPPVFAELETRKMVAWKNEKLICDVAKGFCQLFILQEDPLEARDRSGERPQTVTLLRRHLRGWLERDQDLHSLPVAVDPVAYRRTILLQHAARGDHEAITQLATLVSDLGVPKEERLKALRVLSRQPTLEARPQLLLLREQEADPVVQAWLDVALAKLGNRKAIARVRASLRDAYAQDPSLTASRGMVLAFAKEPESVEAIISSLSSIKETEFRCQLIDALGKSRSPQAAIPLLALFPEIRTRVCVATALAELAEPSTHAFLEERLREESYSTVRLELIRALARIRDPGAIPAIEAALAREDNQNAKASMEETLRLLKEPKGPGRKQMFAREPGRKKFPSHRSSL